jgi:glycosyltransferase involved in cell wall biosynthesis
LVTRNKLPYLRTVCEDLLRHKNPDEEIVVIDGASTDGSVEYLSELHKQGKIDQYISEADYGEAHADNKAIMLARGTLVKIITDDDAIYYPSMVACKNFMLTHPDIDALGTDGVKRRNDPRYPFTSMLMRSKFEARQKKNVPFASCGLGIMFRKSSLPILGLLNPNYVRVDAEYTMRITASKAKMAWYTIESYSHIRNITSNSVLQERRLKEEMEQLEIQYLGKKNLLTLKRLLRDLIQDKLDTFKKPSPVNPSASTYEEWLKLYTTSCEWLERNAKENRGEFLY